MPNASNEFVADISWGNGVITISGNPSTANIARVSLAYYILAEKQEYRDIKLDLTNCRSAFESFMLPLVCLARHHLVKNNVETDLLLPTEAKLQSLFHNSNWQHLISPRYFEPTTYSGTQHVPALQYNNGDEQFEAVNRVLDAVLSSMNGLDRNSLKALEWSLNEITDNVLNHAESDVGGFVQASTFSRSGTVEFVVADAGLGIGKTLGVQPDKVAIEQAVKEGVTRDKNTNQGNGLFGSFRVATISRGQFEIHSGHASMIADADSVRYFEQGAIYPGTLVVARIDCTEEDLLEKGLRFGGESFDPSHDYIEFKYEADDESVLIFVMKDECKSFGSREIAKIVKNKVTNLLLSSPDCKLRVDFDGIFLISSSFADEIFGRLFMELGPLGFTNRIDLVNVDATVRGLIDRAIIQRMATSQSNGGQL